MIFCPARVDDASGYRHYAASQLERAWLVAVLRHLQGPLADIKAILSLEPGAAAERIGHHLNAVEAEHASRRDLAHLLVARLQGKRSAMYEVATRDQLGRFDLALQGV